MLVLSRKAGQALIIGDEITLKVVEIRGQQVRLGVDAPPHVSVVRQELRDAVARENRDAAKSEPEDVERAARKVERDAGENEG
jgi:carbon storage regulator